MTLGTAAIKSTIATSVDLSRAGATSTMNSDVPSEIGNEITTATSAMRIVPVITAAMPNWNRSGCQTDVVMKAQPALRNASIDLTNRKIPTDAIVASTINPDRSATRRNR